MEAKYERDGEVERGEKKTRKSNTVPERCHCANHPITARNWCKHCWKMGMPAFTVASNIYFWTLFSAQQILKKYLVLCCSGTNPVPQQSVLLLPGSSTARSLAVILSCALRRAGFSRLCLHFHCFCANCFLHVCYSNFTLSQSAVLTNSRQVCQREVARLQVHQKVQNVPSSLPSHMPGRPPPPFPPWYIKYLPFLSESWESICSAKRSICNDDESSDVLPIFQQRAPLNPAPWVCSTAHVPGVGMLADGRRAGLAGSIHLVFPFQQNAFPYPRKEAAALGKCASVTCLLPEIVMLGFWKEKISTLLGELWSVHLEKNARDEDGKDGLWSLSGTTGDCIYVKQIRKRAPVTKKEMMLAFPASTMTAKGQALQTGLVSLGTNFQKRNVQVCLPFTLLDQVWTHIIHCLSAYMCLCIYTRAHIYGY